MRRSTRRALPAVPEGIPQAGSVGSLTVEEALTDPCMRGTEVVSGVMGLSRPVEAVGVLDVTDLEGVQPNELLISNAYPLRDVDLEELLTDLASRGGSALGIKLSEYWSRVPDELLKAGDALALPILVLPEGPFDEIVNPLLSLMAARQIESLQRSAELHDALTGAVLREEGRPEAITRSLTRALGAPVGILDDRGEVVAATGREDLWSSAELRWRARSVEETCTLRVDGGRYLALPVRSAGRIWGVILAYDVDPHEPFARAAVAQASVVTGLMLLGRREVERIHLRFEQELLEDLIDGRPADPADARRQAEGIGWPVNRPYALAILRRRPDTADASSVPSFPDGGETALLVRELGRHRDLRVMARRHGVAALIHLKEEEETEHIADSLVRLIKDSPNIPWSVAEVIVAVSDTHVQVTELADAYFEAVIASMVGPKHVPKRDDPAIVRFVDLGAVRLLARAPDRERLVSVARRMLGPLGAEARAHRELFETLEALLSRNMNLSAAAGDMFFHYNTVRHRFSRLRRLLGEPLESAHGRLGLSLAVAAIRLEEIDRTLELKTPTASSVLSI